LATLVIGDIAGQYDAMVRLIDRALKLSKAPIETIVLAGDLVDRGPRSREVVEFALRPMRGVKIAALRGNHEDIMIDCVLRRGYYDYQGDWLANGGGATERSYELYGLAGNASMDAARLDRLPLIYEEPGLIVSHAPLAAGKTLENIRQLNEQHLAGASADTIRKRMFFCWNRNRPTPIPGVLQLHGHNGYYDRFCAPSGVPFAICLDDSRGSESLCGYIWPEGTELRQPYGTQAIQTPIP